MSRRYNKKSHFDELRKNEQTSRAGFGWEEGEEEQIFFRDGCTFVGDLSHSEIVSTYFNKEPMCIVQGNIGVMGACLDSLEWWYDNKKLKQYWHEGKHHKLLLEFVDKLINQKERGQI